MILVVLVGVLAGVGIVTKQARDPLLRELIQKQNQILANLSKLEQGLGSGQNVLASGGPQVVSLLQAQQSLEARIIALETQLKGIQAVFQQAQAGGNQGNVPPPPPQEDLSRVYEISVAHSPVKGNKNAPVTIVEFVDFQCPFCARFHPPIKEVLNAYPDKVNYVLKNFPLDFHPQARPAAKAAFAAGEQGKYWEMVDALLESGRELSEEKHKELAEKLGLNINRFLNDFKNKDAQWEEYIQKDIALGGQIDVRGTPTFYINGRKTNARDFNSLKLEIDQILNKN